MGVGTGLHFPHEFVDAGLQERALVHKSHSGEGNERLEWIGDSVLGLALSRMLYERFPDETSGTLTIMRSALTCNSTLSEIAVEIGVPNAIRTNERMPGLRTTASVLANALEALFGAVFLDGGLEAVHKAVQSVFAERIRKLDPANIEKDAKTRLNELLLGRRMPTAVYQADAGADGQHTVACTVGGREVGQGSGRNRLQAEQAAAAAALEALADG